MGKPLVIVESPTKKNLIQKFLGSSYVVEASVGHIRDLPESAKDVPDEARAQGFSDMAIHLQDDFRPWYVVPDRQKKNVSNLKALMKDASELLLATDEDREGESISWHLREILKPKVPVKRLVFHEITPEAIQHALAHPRTIDENLVAAQEARRVIDRLYGFSISRVLWRKVKGARSAGRVQSPAVRLLVDRERARMAFVASTWWDLEATLGVDAGSFGAHLLDVGGKRIAKGRDFDETTGKLAARDVLLLDEAGANALVARLAKKTGRVTSVETKPWRERPAPPFTTSTLQQEANRKLRWTAKRTMQVAQRLYESGWITYMRTDSTNLSDQAIQAARTLIRDQYGASFLPADPRRYSSKAKNAQEAHEAIRPAGARFRTLDEARRELETDQARLFELIWKRAVACQMADATGEQLNVVVQVEDARFGASGRTIRFPGFQRAYVEGSDDPDAELADRERILPAMAQGDAARVDGLSAKGHVTQPPARFTEASLVKELERLGIGRPSTYADIMEVIEDRGYAFKRASALVPTHLAFLLTAFMEQQLTQLVSYDFTARLEDELDQVSVGEARRPEVLARFYRGDEGLEHRLELAIAADTSGVYRLPLAGRPPEPVHGDLHVRTGQYGAYVTDGERTANVPKDMAPDEVTVVWALEQLEKKAAGPDTLGNDPVTGEPVFVLNGRFGPYVQRGENKGKTRAPSASLPKGMAVGDVTLDLALKLLALPRTLGKHDGEDVTAQDGKFGPYIRCGKETRSIPADISVFDITLAQAEELLAAPRQRPTRGARTPVAPMREFGPDPVSGGPIKLMEGRFGPYVTDGTTNASLRKGTDPAALTPEEAAALLSDRRAAGPAKPKRGRAGANAAPAAATRRAASATSATAAGDAPVKKPRATKASALAASDAPAKKPRATGTKKPAAAKKSPGTRTKKS